MRALRKYLYVAAVLALAGSGCRSVTDPGEGAVVMRRDKVGYTARILAGAGTFTRYGFTAVVTTRNLGRQAVYLSRCYPDTPVPIHGVELVDGDPGRQSAYDALWACVGHENQFELRPGESRTDVLLIQGPNAWESGGEPIGTLTGRMRVTYEVRRCRESSPCALPVRVASNTFQVTVERP